MKKFLIFAIAFLLVVSTAYASVGVKKDGVHEGEATDINISRGSSSFDGSTVTLYGSGMRGGVTANVSTESHLTSAALAYGVIDMRAGSAKTIALANGVIGQMITIVLTVYDGATVTITDDGLSASAQALLKKTGWDDIALNSSLDSVTLLYVDDTTGWVVIANNGCTIT
jgi:hypothetical protein